MVTDERLEELIREIAVKHGIVVGRDDPILVLQTINARLMQESAAAQQAIVDNFRSELESMTRRWAEESRLRTEKLLDGAVSAGRDVMARGLLDSARAAADIVRRDVQSVADSLRAPVRDARRVSMMNMVAALMAVIAAGLAVWASR